MKKVIFSLIMIIFSSVLLAGCGEPDLNGIVIKADDNTVLVAGNLSMERYQELKGEISSDVDMFETVKQEVRDTEGEIDFVDFTYDDADEFKVGDEVNVWVSKNIGESFPRKAEAGKITMKE